MKRITRTWHEPRQQYVLGLAEPRGSLAGLHPLDNLFSGGDVPDQHRLFDIVAVGVAASVLATHDLFALAVQPEHAVHAQRHQRRQVGKRAESPVAHQHVAGTQPRPHRRGHRQVGDTPGRDFEVQQQAGGGVEQGDHVPDREPDAGLLARPETEAGRQLGGVGHRKAAAVDEHGPAAPPQARRGRIGQHLPYAAGHLPKEQHQHLQRQPCACLAERRPVERRVHEADHMPDRRVAVHDLHDHRNDRQEWVELAVTEAVPDRLAGRVHMLTAQDRAGVFLDPTQRRADTGHPWPLVLEVVVPTHIFPGGPGPVTPLALGWLGLI